MITHQDIARAIESFAPLALQESYDNSGWQLGSPNDVCKGVLINLDLTEAVLDEAITLGCNLIITHHPLIFAGIKKLTGKNMVEKIIIKAIQNGISVYAAHTNLDNVKNGVNLKIAEQLELKDLSILQTMKGRLLKLFVFVPVSHAAVLQDALFQAGAGAIGQYSECSFTTQGQGSFRPGSNTQPFIGTAGGDRSLVEEIKIEVIVPDYLQMQVTKAMRAAHPYEEIAHDWVLLQNENQDIGAGIVGYLPQALSQQEFLAWVKEKMQAEVIRYTDCKPTKIQKVAVCGGSGSFLMHQAKALACDAFITADYKYHQFFEGENQIMITDIGHYESEQFTSKIFYDIIKDKFPNFAVQISNITTNPVKYYY